MIVEHLLESLYKDHQTAMYHKAYNVLRDHGLAEDAVHEAFLRISKHLVRFDAIQKEELRYVCLAVVKNTALNLLRKRGDSLPLTDNISAVFVDSSTKLDLTAAIKSLDESYQQIVMLRLWYGFDTYETARLLGLTQSQVFNRLSRAKKILREVLSRGDTLKTNQS